MARAVRAWAPVFAWLGGALGSEFFGAAAFGLAAGPGPARPGGADGPGAPEWVTEAVTGPVVFAAAKVVDAARRIGKLSMLAVDPAAPGKGIGTGLSGVAPSGCECGDTRGDDRYRRRPRHAPARRVSERAGYSLLSIGCYFRNRRG